MTMTLERRQQLDADLADLAAGVSTLPQLDPIVPTDLTDCEHRVVVTWVVAPEYPDAGKVMAWACGRCRLRFVPEPAP